MRKYMKLLTNGTTGISWICNFQFHDIEIKVTIKGYATARIGSIVSPSA